jgi:4-amino-4-deoxy-L-arabinose transferase-like glycosyltransferase
MATTPSVAVQRSVPLLWAAGAVVHVRLWLRAHAFHGLILFVYFGLFAVSLARGEPLHVLHWDDEINFHLPLIVRYAESGFTEPGLVQAQYSTATPPLFHATFGVLYLIFGGNLWWLRAINLLLTALIPCLVYRGLRQRVGSAYAFTMSLTVAFVPYVWTRGYVLLTESLATLLVVFALLPFARPAPPKLARNIGSALWLALAVATRQHWVFVAAGIISVILADASLPWRTRAKLAAPYLLPVFTVLWFFVAWGGMVPPSFRAVNETSSNFRAVAFTWTALGLYVLGMGPTYLWRRAKRLPRTLLVAALIAAVAAVLVGLRFQSHKIDNGYLWKISSAVPSIFGANPLLVVLTAIGVFYCFTLLENKEWAFASVLAMFALSFLPIRQNFQKYYEPALLLFVCAHLTRHKLTRWDQLGQAGLATCGAVYVLTKLG